MKQDFPGWDKMVADFGSVAQRTECSPPKAEAPGSTPGGTSTPTRRTKEAIFVTTFPPTSSLSSPRGDEPIPVGTLGYFQARNRNRLYDLVVGEFIRSGISQATLARRLRKNPDVICRWLSAPENWTLDTASNLLFAISGAEPRYELSYPLDEASRGHVQPGKGRPEHSSQSSEPKPSHRGQIATVNGPKIQTETLPEPPHD
jgi:hypothetical protein